MELTSKESIFFKLLTLKSLRRPDDMSDRDRKEYERLRTKILTKETD